MIDEDVMRYVVGQFLFLARLVEMGGQVCERVPTAGGGSMCKRHGWPWTDSQPCPVVNTIGRAELVTHIRTMARELEDFLSEPPDFDERNPSESASSTAVSDV